MSPSTEDGKLVAQLQDEEEGAALAAKEHGAAEQEATSNISSRGQPGLRSKKEEAGAGEKKSP